MTAAVEPSPSRWRLLWTPVGLLVAALAAMWAIEIVDTDMEAEDPRFVRGAVARLVSLMED